MNIKKILSYGIFFGLLIVLIACIPDGWARIASWLVPPRLYLILAVVIILVLYKILIELRNKNVQEQPSSIDVVPDTHLYSSEELLSDDHAPSHDVFTSPVSSSSHAKVWSETVDNFLARNQNAKLVKLAGKPEEFAYCEVGNHCHVYMDEDDEERFCVFCGDDMIGRLPVSAINYAEHNDCSPEDLSVIVSSIDYDVDKDRYYISVYISD